MRPRITILLTLLAPLLFFSGTRPAIKMQHVSFLNSSELYLQGSSNVNQFTCRCEQGLAPLQVNVDFKPEDQIARFERAQLNIVTRNLDCGNRGMNRDMYKTLQANNHPEISIQLRAVRQLEGYSPMLCDEWVPLLASAYLTIAGKKRIVHLDVQGRQEPGGHYRFLSELTINMTDFGIDPPTALLGLVQVDNEITIHLDLHVSAKSIG